MHGLLLLQFKDMKNDKQIFRENFHMSLKDFNALFKLVQPLLKAKKRTRNDAISPRMKLAFVLE